MLAPYGVEVSRSDHWNVSVKLLITLINKHRTRHFGTE